MTGSINTKIIFLAILIAIAHCESPRQNFQRRQLYYDSYDYACHEGEPPRKDIVSLVLSFPDHSYKKFKADGGTACRDNIRSAPWYEVIPVKNWNYYFRNDDKTIETEINFKQTITIEYIKFTKRTKSIVVNATVSNPVKIENELFDCEIDGDGQIQHFGYYERRSIAIIFMDCMPRNKSVEQE